MHTAQKCFNPWKWQPWFTSEILYNIRLRDRLRKLYLKSRRIADRLSYKRQRNKVNNMKKICLGNYINNIDNIISNHDISNSSKTFWQIMGRFMGQNNTSTNSPPLHTEDISRLLKLRKSWCPEQLLYICFWYRKANILSLCYLKFGIPNPKSKTS